VTPRKKIKKRDILTDLKKMKTFLKLAQAGNE
jgi:hypothetical protein